MVALIRCLHFLFLETWIVKNLMSSTREIVSLCLWYYVIYLYRVRDSGSWWFWTMLAESGNLISNVFGNNDWCRWWLSFFIGLLLYFWTVLLIITGTNVFCKLVMLLRVTNVFITCSLWLMRIDICYTSYVHQEWTLDSRLRLNTMILADNLH